jgi:TfoX/Sxy family transcriptional regulator of competence genes
MKEYVVAPASLVRDEDVLRKWISRSLDYARSLPPKKAKSSRKKPG